MSYRQTFGSASNITQNHVATGIPESSCVTEEGGSISSITNTAILPMHWVGRHWMEPSGSSFRSQPKNTTLPNLMSLVPHNHNASITPPFALEPATTISQTHRISDTPSLRGSRPYLPPYQYSFQRPEDTRNSGGRHSQHIGHYHSVGSSGYTRPVVTQQPRYEPIRPPAGNPTWEHQAHSSRLKGTPTYSRNEDHRHKAHLDSEKKRRESITSGFPSLRRVIPANNDNDSRATTLEKAVEYINHLESLLQESRRDRGDNWKKSPTTTPVEKSELAALPDSKRTESYKDLLGDLFGGSEAALCRAEARCHQV